MMNQGDAGDWLFCGRKWIDPADPDGRTKLDLHHHNLSILFPAFASACPRERFLAAVAGVIERWSQHPSAATAAETDLPVADVVPERTAGDATWSPTEAGSDSAPCASEADLAGWPDSDPSPDPATSWSPDADGGGCRAAAATSDGWG